MDEALPAVTVPSFRKAGRRLAILSGRAFLGPSSSSTFTGSPRRWGTSTGTISSLNFPAFQAAMARSVDITEYSSWAARGMSHSRAQSSAALPMWKSLYGSQRPSWIIRSTSSPLPMR